MFGEIYLGHIGQRVALTLEPEEQSEPSKALDHAALGTGRELSASEEAEGSSQKEQGSLHRGLRVTNTDQLLQKSGREVSRKIECQLSGVAG